MIDKDTIYRQDAIDAIASYERDSTAPINYRKIIEGLPSADVQPVTFCKDCQWLADIKDIETGELYHTCGVLGFDVPDGFACNQGKRKGVDE